MPNTDYPAQPGKGLQPIRWAEDAIMLLDQRQLPERIEYLRLTTVQQVWEAIRELKVRGAPAIGIAAAFAVVLAMPDDEQDTEAWPQTVLQAAQLLATSRPTAVNLFWALERMKARAAALQAAGATAGMARRSMQEEADSIQREDEATNRQIGQHALSLFQDGMGVLTHCNAGGLATSKYGTALAPFYLALEQGVRLKVFAGETRPVLQGARLTAFELQQAGVDVTLITDNMAGHIMSKGWVQAVIVGTDRVAANGDVANKIGTYSLAVLAKAHQIPFYVACPKSTIDLATPTGADIPIEERHPDEVTSAFGRRTAPAGVSVYNPAFDITPHEWVTAIITEAGIIRAPYNISLAQLFAEA